MIVFFAPFPLEDEEKKRGLAQRIMAIDDLFSSRERVYLEVSYRKNWSAQKIQIDGKAYLYKLNAFIHFFSIIKILSKATVVYYHTVANGLKFLPYTYIPHLNRLKKICDMHGVLPEECIMDGSKYKYFMYKLVERLVLRDIDEIICVSEVMRDHYNIKYGKYNLNSIILPIYTTNVLTDLEKDTKVYNLNVIYAGGVQVWQNVGEMLELARLNKDLNFEFWFPKQYAEKYRNLNLNDNISFRTGSQIDVKDAYQNVSLGLALRDTDAVNRVACPTKIVEYIENGVVPILKSTEIGDFVNMGLKYLKISELNGDQLNINLVEKYAKSNQEVFSRFCEIIQLGKKELIKSCRV